MEPIESIQVCTVCGVAILDGTKVKFSHGSMGSRERLAARVCHFLRGEHADRGKRCINQGIPETSITVQDRYGDGPPLPRSDDSQSGILAAPRL